MQEKKLFEYAVVRLVPQVHREEFLNAGVILFCAKEKFLDLKYILDENRIKSLFPKTNLDTLKEFLNGMNEIVKGNQGTIGKLPAAERFRWLTSTRSSIVQCSKVHPGLCDDAAETLNKLFHEMVEI